MIHPELIVVNADGTPENIPPEDLYKEEFVFEEEKEGILEKIKSFLGQVNESKKHKCFGL